MNAETHRKWLLLLSTLGTLYFTALPLAVWFADYALPQVTQQEFITGAVYLSQLVTIGVLLFQFIRRDSLYCQLSYKRQKTGSTIADFNKLN